MGVVEVNWTVVGARKRRAQPIRNAERQEEAEVCPLGQHPEWTRLREKIMVALGPFVEARRALERALAPERGPMERDW